MKDLPLSNLYFLYQQRAVTYIYVGRSPQFIIQVLKKFSMVFVESVLKIVKIRLIHDENRSKYPLLTAGGFSFFL